MELQTSWLATIDDHLNDVRRQQRKAEDFRDIRVIDLFLDRDLLDRALRALIE